MDLFGLLLAFELLSNELYHDKREAKDMEVDYDGVEALIEKVKNGF